MPAIADLDDLLCAGRISIACACAGGEDASGACGCPFFQRHGMRRGPCKHLLAARMVAGGAVRHG